MRRRSDPCPRAPVRDRRRPAARRPACDGQCDLAGHPRRNLQSTPYPFFNAPATTEIYALSLHDALPISSVALPPVSTACAKSRPTSHFPSPRRRSEEHTSELQSLRHLVCRLLLEKK